MKKLLMLFVAVSVMASFTSCKEDACKTNNTGDVIVTNNTSETLWFDVTGDDGLTTENRSLAPGSSTTYTITAGNAKIWASYTNNNADFMLVHIQSLAQCAVIDFQSAVQACALFNVTDVEVINNTGYNIYVNIRQDGDLFDQITLNNNEYVIYGNIWAGSKIDFGIYIPSIMDNWFWENNVVITACETYELTWTYSKFIQAKEAGVSETPIDIVYIPREKKR
jgi:hypothetical protein